MVSWVLPRELEDVGKMYEDETKNGETFLQLADKLGAMPEVVHHYIGTDILLPTVGKMARGNIAAQSCDANGNVMSISNAHPILYTRLYRVEMRLQNKPPTSLQSQCMPTMIEAGMRFILRINS